MTRQSALARQFGHIKMFVEPDDSIQGDDARMYWLGVIHDELTGELAASHSTGELSQKRFEFTLQKVVNLCNTAVLAGGAKFDRMEH
jgi:hypothetical protein